MTFKHDKARAHVAKLLHAHWFQAALSGVTTGLILFFFRELLAGSRQLELLSEVLPGIVALLVAVFCLVIDKLVKIAMPLRLMGGTTSDTDVRPSPITVAESEPKTHDAAVANAGSTLTRSVVGIRRSESRAAAFQKPSTNDMSGRAIRQSLASSTAPLSETTCEVLAYPDSVWHYVDEATSEYGNTAWSHLRRGFASLTRNDAGTLDGRFAALRRYFSSKRQESLSSTADDEDLDEQIMERAWSMGGCPHF